MAKTKSIPKKETHPSGSKTLHPKKDTGQDYKVTLIPEKYQTPAYLALILISILIFFGAGIFGTKNFSSPDNIASNSFNTYLQDAKKDGVFPLWIPYIFCGMPSFAALVPHLERMYDYSQAVWVIIRDLLYALDNNNQVWAVVLFYIIFGFAFYFLADYQFKNKLIALYCALAAVFITPIIQMIIVGHNSKMIAVMMFPVVFLFIEKIYDYFSQPQEKGSARFFKLMLYFSALVFFLHVQMSSNHIQMLFYFYMAFGFYLLYRLIYNIVKKVELSVILKTIAIFVLAAGLSALMDADSYMSTKEYSKYSIRGVAPITSQTASNQGTELEEKDYEYATNWSFSPTEVMTLFIPSWVGFGDIEYQGQRANTYWGQMPFTTSPMYFGILTILLAFIGIYYHFRKNVLVQALTIISIISLILSFGRTLPVLYDILFYHLPYFSSFRAPVMIHILINVSFVLLAGLGIKTVIDISKDKAASARFTSAGKYIFPLLALPLLISLIGFQGYYASIVSSSDYVQKLQAAGYNASQVQQIISQISTIAYDNAKSDMMLIGFILLLGYGFCYFFVRGDMKYKIFLPALIILLMFDLWRIDYKTLEWNTKSENEGKFKTPDYVDWVMKNEKNLYEFRVLDLSNNSPIRENTLAYWRLENLYGYQGAKLRIFQDMDDVAGLTNPFVWKLAGVKYIFSNKPNEDTTLTKVYQGSKYVYLNKDVLPKAHFASAYRIAGGLEILNNIKQGNFDLNKMVFFEKDPGIKIDVPDSTAKVQITKFGIHDITFEAEASGNNLLFINEVYYPAGWKALIDGQPAEIYKTDYLFRSILIPRGKHKIEMKFEPETYYTGKKIAIGSNIILIAFFVFSICGIYLKSRKKEEKAQTSDAK